MTYPANPSALSPEAADASRLHLASHILRLADGDPAFAARIREMMWGEYRAAGAPLGLSEEGMFVWWGEELSGVPG